MVRMVLYSATRMNRTAAKIRQHGKSTLAVRDRKSPAFARRSDKEKKDQNCDRQYCSCEERPLKILPHKAKAMSRRQTRRFAHPAPVAR